MQRQLGELRDGVGWVGCRFRLYRGLLGDVVRERGCERRLLLEVLLLRLGLLEGGLLRGYAKSVACEDDDGKGLVDGLELREVVCAKLEGSSFSFRLPE